MRNLVVFLKGYVKETILAPSFKLLEVVFDLLVPIVVAQIIDVGIANNDHGYIVQRFIILLVMAAVGLTCSITAQFFAAKASTGFAAKLRQALFDHIQGLSFTELDTLGTNTLITRLTDDVNQVQNGLNMGLRLLLRSPFIVIGAMILAFTINVKCAIIFVVIIPILFAVIFSIMLVSIPLFKKVQAKLDHVTGLTRENLTGIRVIRAFCREEQSMKEFDDSVISLRKLNEFVGRLSALLNPVTYVLINLATVFLINRAGIEVNIGNLQQGQVVALYNYMAQIIVELIKLASLIITLNKAMACAHRVSDVLKVKSSMHYPQSSVKANETINSSLVKPSENVGLSATTGNNPASGLSTDSTTMRNISQLSGEASTSDFTISDSSVVFQNVTFTYEGAGDTILSDISFTAKKGDTIGIIGGTGSGKSSLINLIPRFYDADSGQIFIDGQDILSYDSETLHKKIGVVPQKAVLFHGSIRDNLKWGKQDATDTELWEALTTAQAKEVVEGKPGQLDFELEQNGKNLSGGQRQRLTIARALVRKPEILILDDSASALDFATDAALRKALHQLSGQTTTFLVSQRAASIRQADLILVLNNGELVGKGTHDELMANCGVYQEIYFSQFPEERKNYAGGTAR